MSMRIASLQQALWLLLLTSAPVLAGHGFVTAFANIEGLPDPGRTPDSAWYRIDAWQEEGQLVLAHSPEAKVRLSLTFAREKLAEIEVMVKAENAPAAEVAANRYRLYIDWARHITADARETATKESLADILANALLEHQYVLSMIYEELPTATRAIVPQVIATAQERYQDIIQILPPKKKGALFFKEDEVRWSVRMALRTETNS